MRNAFFDKTESVLYMMSDLCFEYLKQNKHKCDGCPLKIPVGIKIEIGNDFFYDDCMRKVLFARNHEFGMPPMPKESEVSK